ncbi:MAG: GspH/FimT family pseudopilin [Gammaproteobacteria bacterium]
MSLPAQNAGFTLIELMIVMVVVAIFVTVGVPNFQNMISDNRLSTQANSLVSSLQLARSEALKLGTPVSVCRTTNGTACAGVGTSWESGWLVFVDANASGGLDGGERIILSNGGLSGGNTLRAAAPFNNFISYLPNGLQSAANGSFRLCNGNVPDVTQGRRVLVSPTGHVQTLKGGFASCT